MRHTVCGILMHANLVVTPEGWPLRLTAITFWFRETLKGANALKEDQPDAGADRGGESIRWLQNLEPSTARISDPARCVPIGDRESDITRLFCKAQEVGTRLLLRTCVDRCAGDGSTTIAEAGQKCRAKGSIGSRCGIAAAACHRPFSSSRCARSQSCLPSTSRAAILRLH